MGFGNRVKKVLDDRGLKQVDLCRMAEIKSGLLSPYMTNPDKDPKLSTACKIALALDVSLDYLGGLIDEPKPIQRDEDGNIVAPGLSQQEDELIGLYRDSNAQGRTTIMGVARLQPGMEGKPPAREVRGA